MEMQVGLLDYGAGNVRSVENALRQIGVEVVAVERPGDLSGLERLLFPGVGDFGLVMSRLKEKGYLEPLRRYLQGNGKFLGICVGLQSLFEESEEAPGVRGLGILPGTIKRFAADSLSVPHIGWNSLRLDKKNPLFEGYSEEHFYFVHSYYAPLPDNNDDWLLATTDYGQEFVSAVAFNNITAFQFHPEKSGSLGLQLLEHYFSSRECLNVSSARDIRKDRGSTRFAKRIVACLDVRSNDAGDLVVTKGDQYDVRDSGGVRNLGKPVDLAFRYYEDGADEIAFLNITAFRNSPLQDQPMLELLRKTSEKVFVPLTIGGGIRDFTDVNGRHISALDIAEAYFRAGADKISIGSDAVFAAEHFITTGKRTGTSSIEQISAVYGAQAVVISVDPRRMYVHSPRQTPHRTLRTALPGPNNEQYCWFQCTVKGGREGRDLDVVQLAQACESLGAGEILLNCIDRDGTNAGFDLELISQVKEAVTIPVIASSGAGAVQHFVDVFRHTRVEAALAAGIFHRKEVEIRAVKTGLAASGIVVRRENSTN